VNEAIGGQFSLNGHLYLGLSAGTNNYDLVSGNEGNSTQEGHQLGMALKYVSGPWLFATSLSTGTGLIATSRTVEFDHFVETLTSDREVFSENLRVRAANALEMTETSYIKSVLDLNVTHVSTDAATEVGGDAALSYHASSATVYSIAPEFEVGQKIAVSKDEIVNPFFRFGALRQWADTQELSANFAESNATDDDFTVTSSLATVRTSVAVGLNVVRNNYGSLNLLYSHQFGDGAEIDSLSVKGTLRF
jgi:Autotransporter beta-domain